MKKIPLIECLRRTLLKCMLLCFWVLPGYAAATATKPPAAGSSRLPALYWTKTLPNPAPEVKGTVRDEQGEVMVGVSVLEKGTQNGTVTDLDGSYTLVATNPWKYPLKTRPRST